MPEYNIMPAKCCCCSLQTASIVVGIFSLIFALIFMGLTAAFSNGLGRASCSTSKCTSPSEAEKMVSNLLAILAVINAVEVIMSIGMIWGASKNIGTTLLFMLTVTSFHQEMSKTLLDPNPLALASAPSISVEEFPPAYENILSKK
ncbi:Protein of unknown function [Gryllus bimaculatus]|nr:Protein of unknown function [Gryllus bimaculatus]